MIFKTLATIKETGEKILIESDYSSKKEFITDLRKNGYAVSDCRVKKSEVYDYIINETNATPDDWRYINEIGDDADEKAYQALIKRIKKLSI